MLEVTCNGCGWVHFAISRKKAEKDIGSFNKYFDRLTYEQQQERGMKRSSVEQYEKCSRCGTVHTNFRVSEKDDCPLGVTIGPIIYEQ